MRLHANRSRVEGTVLRIARSDDGFGAEVEFAVSRCDHVAGSADFIGAQPGQQLTLFAAVPEALSVGGRFRQAITALGGPGGQRLVVQSAEDLPPRDSDDA